MALGFQCVIDKMRRKFSKNTRPDPLQGGPQKVYLRSKNSLLRAFFFIGVSLILASCFDRGDCLITNTNIVKVDLKDVASPKISRTAIFTSIHIPDVGVLYQQDTLSTLLLVVDPRVEETKFVFQYNNRSDTLVLGYTNQTLVLSPDCGSFNYQSELEVRYSTFGTGNAIIKNQRLLTTVPLNVEIYL
jgi:hypothetical protein